MNCESANKLVIYKKGLISLILSSLTTKNWVPNTDSPGRKLGKGSDNIYHVVGELIVAHEITQAAAVTNLKRIIAVCGGRLVIIITPFPRYIKGKYCDAGDHCTLLAVPESGDKIFDDLRRVQLSAVPNCQVVAAGDLLLNKKKAAMAEIMEAYSNSWGTVHAAAKPPKRGCPGHH